MKIKIVILLFAVTISITGCSSISMKQLSDDTYSIHKVDHKGVFGSKAAMIEEVEARANDLAVAQGGKVSGISSNYTPPGIGVFATYTYEFRISPIKNDLDKELASRVSSRCIYKASITYDDGISTADSLAKAVVMKCRYECIDAQIIANNLSVSSKGNIQAQCMDQALGQILELRHTKRNGGDAKKFGNVLYIKRRDDSHFKLAVSWSSITTKNELTLYCQKGTDGNSINMHNIQISGVSLLKDLGLGEKLDSLTKLSVNDSPTYFFQESGISGKIIDPSPDIMKYFNGKSEIVINNGMYSIAFPASNYRDALRELGKECPTLDVSI